MERLEENAIEILQMLCGNSGCVISDSGGKDSIEVDDVMALMNTPNRGNCDYFIVDKIEELCMSDKTTDEQEIRAKAIDEFAERLKDRIVGMQMAELQGEDVCPCHETGEECKYMNQDIACQYCAREQTIKEIDEIAEQLKGGAV